MKEINNLLSKPHSRPFVEVDTSKLRLQNWREKNLSNLEQFEQLYLLSMSSSLKNIVNAINIMKNKTPTGMWYIKLFRRESHIGMNDRETGVGMRNMGF